MCSALERWENRIAASVWTALERMGMSIDSSLIKRQCILMSMVSAEQLRAGRLGPVHTPATDPGTTPTKGNESYTSAVVDSWRLRLHAKTRAYAHQEVIPQLSTP